MMHRAFSALLLSLFAASGSASMVLPRPTAEVLLEAQFVGVVRILRSEVLEFKARGNLIHCGFRYRAEITDSLKGSSRPTNFTADEHLMVGEQYVVALSSKVVSATDVVSTNSAMASGLLDEEIVRKLCRQRYGGPRAIQESISAFSAYSFEGVGDDAARIEWVDYSALANDDSLSVLNVEGSEYLIYRTTESPRTVSAQQLYRGYLIPKYVFEGSRQYLRWSEFRAYLEKQILLPHNKRVERTPEP